MISRLRELVYGLCGLFLRMLMTLWPPSKNVVLLYHAQDIRHFVRQIQVLSKYYNIIALSDVHRIKTIGKNSRPCCIITFDDGLANNYELIKHLNEREIPATLFLTTGYIDSARGLWPERYPGYNLQQLKNVFAQKVYDTVQEGSRENESGVHKFLTGEELDDLDGKTACFAAHTVSHPFLTALESKDAVEEIRQSMNYLQRFESFDPSLFAPPFGDIDNNTLGVLQDSFNFEVVVTITPGFVDESSDLLSLPRIGIPNKCSLNEFVFRIYGGHIPIARVLE